MHVERAVVNTPSQTMGASSGSLLMAWRSLAPAGHRCEEIGVDAFEINFSCPHGMPERKVTPSGVAACPVACT